MLKEIALCGAVAGTTLIAVAGDQASSNSMEMPPGAMAAMMAARGGGGAPGEMPPFEKVIEKLEKVVSTADGSKPLYDLYVDRESGKLLGVLPPNYASQLLMISPTVSGGHPEAGVMGMTYYAQWKKIGKQLALIEPNLWERTSGDKNSKSSMNQLYTGSVITALPIITMSPAGGPVVDLGHMGTHKARKFFPPDAFYGPSFRAVNPTLASLTKVKAFPKNVIFEYEMPNETGQLIRLTYAVDVLQGSPGFKPRKADSRVGYFYDLYLDYAKAQNEDVTDRYITRWNIEKADPSLSMSPPKKPLVWYIEHTTPVKYRRYVREGILMWNESFEKVGIVGALEVYQQDKATGAHMDKDPEDNRYNFFRWNVSNQTYAIGPSRTNPKTGEILDADVVWHQGLTRNLAQSLASLSAGLAELTMSPEELAFFDKNPDWDPRVRLATPVERSKMILEKEMNLEMAATEPLEGRDHPWTKALNDPTNSACKIGSMMAMNMAIAGLAFEAGLMDAKGEGEGDDVPMMDGVPEEFIGQMIRYVSAHEVGHCIGLQHNMAASTIRSLEEVNTPGFEGPTVGSVMDYCAVNINHECGEEQGPYATTEVGPYDDWAIAYGYGPEDKLDEVLSRVSEPDNIFLSQIAMSVGSDPRNMTWDMGADNLKFAESRMSLCDELREKLLEDIVKEGEPWAVARRRFLPLLNTQFNSMYIASRWVGGSYENNDWKGDPGDRAPVNDIPAERQRKAMKLVIDNAFGDDAFGLTPELIRYMGKEYWWDPQGIGELMADPSMPVHDLVGSLQAAMMSIMMNPTKLRRVYDNEYRAQGADDVLTVAEVMDAIGAAVWTDGSSRYGSTGDASTSSFRRNLQREHVDRLIDLALMESTSPSLRTISSLSVGHLEQIAKKTKKANGGDPYTAAHNADIQRRIERAMEAKYVMAR